MKSAFFSDRMETKRLAGQKNDINIFVGLHTLMSKCAFFRLLSFVCNFSRLGHKIKGGRKRG